MFRVGACGVIASKLRVYCHTQCKYQKAIYLYLGIIRENGIRLYPNNAPAVMHTH
jgi:hypothetical protein